jgi:hypothetical protein
LYRIQPRVSGLKEPAPIFSLRPPLTIVADKMPKVASDYFYNIWG